MKELKDLKKGDKLTIQWGLELYTAKVLDNFPDNKKILLKFRYGWMLGATRIFNYHDRNLELFKLKSYTEND